MQMKWKQVCGCAGNINPWGFCSLEVAHTHYFMNKFELAQCSVCAGESIRRITGDFGILHQFQGGPLWELGRLAVDYLV